MKLILNSLFIFLAAISSVAQVTKTNSTSGRVENSTISRTVNYVSGVDFPVGSVITDVNVSINFTRLEDGNAILCSHNGSSPWNGDLAYTLTSPTGTSINLLQGFPSQTYTDQNTYGGNVTINFDQGAASAVNSSTFPIAGTFRPHAGNLNSFNGLTPFGTWTISTNDPFAGFGETCHNSFSITITCSVPCTNPTLPTINPATICNGQSATLNVSSGVLNDATNWVWYTGSCGGTIVGTGNSLTVSPTSTTTYFVRGEGGCVSSGSCSSVTVTVNPLPAISISGTNTICNGSSTTLTASGGNTYLWNTSATTNSITVSPSGTTTYSVTGTDANGCSNSASRTVTVNPLPAISISGTNTICNGSSTTLTASGGNTYLWNTSATTNSITVSPSGTTTYSVIGTDANGCSNSASRTVTVNPIPTILFANNDSRCGTGVVNLSVIGASGSYTYGWYTSAIGGTSLNSTDSYSPSLSNTTTYYVDATENGCTSSPRMVVMGTVNPLPAISISGTNTICNGSSTTLTASGGNTYLWNTSATSNSITVSPSGTTTYSVTGTDGNGCTGNANFLVIVNNTNSGSQSITTCDSYTWSANGTTYTTSGTYTAMLTNISGCDSTATLNLAITNSNSGSQSITVCDSYTWSANGTTYTSSGIYTAMLTNISGCDSTATLNLTITNSNSGSQSITSCDNYTWSANGTTYTTSGTYTAMLTNISGCDSTAILNLTITNSNSGSQSITVCDSYTWSANGITYNTSGTYTAMLTNIFGCDSTAILNLTIHSSPDITTTLNGFTITSNQNGATYQWIDCNNSNFPIVNETGQSFNVVTNGNYAVIVSENGCSDTSQCVLISSVGWHDLYLSDEILIYPNPSSTSFEVKSERMVQQIKLYDISGRFLFSEIVNDNHFVIGQNLPSGIYYLEISSEKNFTGKYKLFKQ